MDLSNERRTTSGIPVEANYGPQDLHDWDAADRLGPAGEFPFTRGPYQGMYRNRLWTMRQYAGFGSAAETNERFRALLDAGQTGLSVAFDLPTQMGLDSDDPRALGEVGKVGVAIDSLEDMRRLFDSIPLEAVSTSMTINATAAALLALYELVAEERGISPSELKGTVQNDILKEYAARGTYIYPPRPSMRLVTDLFAYCSDRLPQWNTISISGYHMREAGATAVQELAFTLANGVAYVEAAVAAGLDVDEVGPRLSFFWNAHSNFFEEIAKYRAARRMWAVLMRDGQGALNPESWRMRFHTQTAGSTLTAQQPENNIVRTALQAMSAVLGGTQSLHTNSYDEALGLPSEDAALTALRTQQIIGYETGIAATIDPFGGSYYVESLTDQVEAQASALMAEVAALGGAVAAIEAGFVQSQIADSAYAAARAIDDGESVVIGVNRFEADDDAGFVPTSVDVAIEEEQVVRIGNVRSQRDPELVQRSLDAIRQAAEGEDNLLPIMKEALGAMATVGEVSEALRDVFGSYRPAQ